jgi:hypothetical protein
VEVELLLQTEQIQIFQQLHQQVVAEVLVDQVMLDNLEEVVVEQLDLPQDLEEQEILRQ